MRIAEHGQEATRRFAEDEGVRQVLVRWIAGRNIHIERERQKNQRLEVLGLLTTAERDMLDDIVTLGADSMWHQFRAGMGDIDHILASLGYDPLRSPWFPYPLDDRTSIPR